MVCPHTPSHTSLALTVGAVITAWYALPDAVSSRPWRVVCKIGLLAAVVGLVGSDADERTEVGIPAHSGEPLSPQVLAIGGAVLAAGAAATVWGEKAVYAFGERRRQRGRKLAHTIPAIALGVLSGLAIAIEPRTH